MLTTFGTRHGAQGNYDTASKSTLENEFGTHNDDEVIKEILEKGTVQESQVGPTIFGSLTPRAEKEPKCSPILWHVFVVMLPRLTQLQRCPNAKAPRTTPKAFSARIRND